VASISDVVLVTRVGFDTGGQEAVIWRSTRLAVIYLLELEYVQVYWRRLGTTGWGERHGVLSMRVPGPLWRRPRYSPCTGPRRSEMVIFAQDR
jgi:hypothetical protein